MTPEQIQQAIEGMLSVQRELQNSQLRFEAEMDIVKQSIEDLAERSKETDERFKATDRRFEQLIGYSINRERDSLDIQQDILDLRHRVVALERKLSDP